MLPEPVSQREEASASAAAPGMNNEFQLSVNGRNYAVKIDGDQAVVNGQAYQVSVQGQSSQPASSTTPAAETSGATTDVTAQMPGTVLRITANVGDAGQSGDTILVVEAMKMEVSVTAPVAGTIRHIGARVGDQVNTGQLLATIG